MIDLTVTEQMMRREIGADAAGWADRVFRGATPDELLPVLMDTFADRYRALPPTRVFSELSYLVKKGLGNAHKWGNGGEPGRMLTVRAAMTDLGAMVAITDEGAGFDVAEVLGRFFANAAHFRHGGSGFSHFHESASQVSYADGGRTFLIRFLCDVPADPTPVALKPGMLRPRRSMPTALARLEPGVQVKVKGRVTSDGEFQAMKVAVKPAEEQASIDARLQHVDGQHRQVRVLQSLVTVPEATEIASAEQRRVELDALLPGQVVEMTGRYSSESGFVPAKVQVRHSSASDVEEIQGRVEAIHPADGVFVVLGIPVVTSDETEFKDKRPMAEECTR